MIRKQIFILIVLFVMICGCSKKEYSACVNQTLDDVSSIELLDTQDNKETVLYALSDFEFASFWSELMTIRFFKCFNDPPTEYGILAVKITYLDGYIDIIGTDINGYYSPVGDGQRTGWYYAANKEDFVSLFAQYIDDDILPIIE